MTNFMRMPMTFTDMEDAFILEHPEVYKMTFTKTPAGLNRCLYALKLEYAIRTEKKDKDYLASCLAIVGEVLFNLKTGD